MTYFLLLLLYSTVTFSQDEAELERIQFKVEEAEYKAEAKASGEPVKEEFYEKEDKYYDENDKETMLAKRKTRALFAGKAIQNSVELPFKTIESLFNTITARSHPFIKAYSKAKLKKEAKLKNEEKLKVKLELEKELIRLNLEVASPPSIQTVDTAQAIPYCKNEFSNEYETVVNKIASLENILQEKSCVCTAWNNCPDKDCNCEQLCPYDFTVMRKTADQVVPKVENQLSFRNHQKDIYKYEELSGFCWGHATVGQRMSQLAIFDEDAKIEHKKGSKEWVRYYKRLIDDLVLNNARKVEGFKNLYEFSGHPLLEDYIATKVSTTWAKQSASIKNIKHFLPLRNKYKLNQRFLKRVMEYIDYGISPIIVKTNKIRMYNLGSIGNSHVVVAYKYETRGDGSVVIYLRDNSLEVEDNEYEPNQISFVDDGEAISTEYDMHMIDQHFKRDIVQQVNSMQKLCKQMMCENQD